MVNQVLEDKGLVQRGQPWPKARLLQRRAQPRTLKVSDQAYRTLCGSAAKSRAEPQLWLGYQIAVHMRTLIE